MTLIQNVSKQKDQVDLRKSGILTIILGFVLIVIAAYFYHVCNAFDSSCYGDNGFLGFFVVTGIVIAGIGAASSLSSKRHARSRQPSTD